MAVSQSPRRAADPARHIQHLHAGCKSRPVRQRVGSGHPARMQLVQCRQGLSGGSRIETGRLQTGSGQRRRNPGFDVAGRIVVDDDR